jgi:hypothetical protein
MKPENPNIPPALEGNYLSGENAPDRLPVLPAPQAVERDGLERSVEHKERAAEAKAAAADANDYSNPVQPVVVSTTQPDDTNDDSTNSPITASDDDVIEKEWVDRAKKVISDTKDDPYKREEQVNKLQKDYLQKRYGKSLGASS